MVTLGELMVRVGADISGFERAMGTFNNDLKTAKKNLSGLGSALKDAGTTLTASMTAPLIGIGGAAIHMSNDLNAAMANVATMVPKSTARIQELKAAVQHMAVAVGKSTGDLAGGLYQVISAFGDSADTVKILDVNARAAAAGVATTTDAINLTSAVTKGYGDTSLAAVQKVSDLAFQTVKLGQTTFPELAASIGRVTPLAASLGVKMEEMFGVMATGTGVTGTAAEVSTQLRGILQSLMAPTEEMGTLISNLGFASGEAMLRQLGLQGTINTIVKAAKDAQAPLQSYISQIEGQTLALALSGPQAAVFTEKLRAMGNVAGATDEAFREQTDGINKTGFAWAQLQQKMAVTAQQLGDVLAPALFKGFEALNPLLELVQRGVSWFVGLDTGTQKLIITLGALAAATGPVLVGVGAVANGVASLVPIISGLGTAFTFLAANPIGAVITAIAGLVAVGIYLYNNWDSISAKLTAIWSDIQARGTAAWNGLGAALRSAGHLVLAAIQEPFDSARVLIQGVISEAADWGRNLIGQFIQGIKSSLGRLSEAAKGAAGTVSDYLGFHSPTEKGPGQDADVWGPNLVHTFAAGIRQAVPQLQGVVRDLVAPLSAMTNPATPAVSPVSYYPSPARGEGATQHHHHTGSIRVEGVSDQGQLVGITDLIARDLLRDQDRYSSSRSARRVFR